MCETIVIRYTNQILDLVQAEEYDPKAAGHTCTCELKDTPSSPADPEALAAFGRWVMRTYQKARDATGEYAIAVLLHMH